MVFMNQNMGDRLLFPPKLPKPGKTKYNALCEADEEYNQNKGVLSQMVDIEIKNRFVTYKDYSLSDQSAIGPHYHAFKDSIDLGSDYTAHLGMMWPPIEIDKVCIDIAITKDFVMADGCSYTLGEAYIDGGMRPVFFTEFFWEIFGDTTKFGKNMFFLNMATSVKSLYGLSMNTGEVRWLLYEGLVLGRRCCRYDVFHDFTNDIQYMDDWDKDDMEFDMWNEV